MLKKRLFLSSKETKDTKEKNNECTDDSEEEALNKVIEEWGEENIIIPPHKPDCLERLQSVKDENTVG